MTRFTATPEQTLTTQRMIWAAMVWSVVMIGGLFVFVIGSDELEGGPNPLFVFIAWAIVLTAIPMGLFIRGQIFKRGWVGETITPTAYRTGNIVAWSCCEGAAVVSLVFISVDGLVHIVSALVAWVMLVLLWPNGRAMFGHRDDARRLVAERKE